MELREVLPTTQILDEEIRRWEADDSRTKNTHRYIAHDYGAEVGFLSVDIDPECE
jgi:GNAT superfamily N-acetyltransferase